MPKLLIFIVDNYRNHEILEKNNQNIKVIEVYKLFQGYADLMIAATNLANVVESLNMGYVFLGSILNDIGKLIKLLSLPKYTFPVIGLGFGYPDYIPRIKPKINYEVKVFEDEYKRFDNYKELIKNYDEIMSNYYKSRDANSREDNFSQQLIKKIAPAIEIRKQVIKFLLKQGYKLNI
ncbi:NADPH-dependent oxidoreductase [Peptoniphilus sp. AGMB00490]|uniref:NADPH-dependent oxidoreductase n=1 Tax=Peptoniphilus faecalis TaxID=2731255 RepID=A0A848RBH5_9FIRM|nr:NADPH-dependent oxidoreductase [Peptoniphilus faecalis]NMW84180.1 NADPH-dependent oxidoreductase [Peptoniphilus faecalis]